MCGASPCQIVRSIPVLIAACHCEPRAAISLRGILRVGLFLLAIASTADAKYSGGSGTAQDPYQIATAAATDADALAAEYVRTVPWCNCGSRYRLPQLNTAIEGD